jgi:hypothetical protein
MPTSPTQRTLKVLKEQGFNYDIVERFKQHAGPFGIRQDFLGIIDLIAITPGRIIGVQCCGQSGFAAHDRTISDSEMSLEWLKAGGELELWAWRKLKKKRGGKAIYWSPRIKIYTLEDWE